MALGRRLDDKDRLKTAEQILINLGREERMKAFDAVRLYESIVDKVIGQNVLAGLVASKISASGILDDSTKPRCSLFVSGMPGVGKSYFAKTVAQAVYPKLKKPYLLLNCGEVLDKSSFDSMIFGTAARYRGSGKSPIANYLSKNPSGGVIIFDEIEKAIKSAGEAVASVFLGIMQEGELSDADRKNVYKLNNHIIIFTSNEKQEELTAVADRVLADLEVKIEDDQHGKHLVLPPEADAITSECEAVLLEESCFDGAFLRRLDFIASVKTLDDLECLQLAEVLFIKYCNGKKITQFSDDIYDVLDTQFYPWFAHKIKEVGQAQGEGLVEAMLERDRAKIVVNRARAGKDAEFVAMLEPSASGFRLLDASEDDE